MTSVLLGLFIANSSHLVYALISMKDQSNNKEPGTPAPESETPQSVRPDLDSYKQDNDTAEPHPGKPKDNQLEANIQKKKSFRFWHTEKLFPKPLRNKLGKAARPLSLGIVIIIVAAAGVGIWQLSHSNGSVKGVSRFQAKVVSFKVDSLLPSANQKNVNPTTKLTINFTQPVNPQKLVGNLFITPNIAGTFSQGKTSSQAIFTPKVPFPQGTKVQVMLNGSYQSLAGRQLGADYVSGFTTALPQNGVIFEDSSGLYSTVSSAPTGQKESYSLVFGSNVSPGVTVSLYKSGMNDLLSSLIYSNTTSNGYVYPSFNAEAIDTSSMTLISHQSGLDNGSSYDVTQNNGIYVAIATDSSGKQLGSVWLDYSDFGVVAREDDQKIVLDAQSFSNDSDVQASVKIYNLSNAVNLLNQTTVDGLTTIPSAYSPSADVVVASDGTSQALVPLSILESLGDIRVDQNLSTSQAVYGVTDRPTYSDTDTVRYAGFARTNDDAQYGSSSDKLLHLYVATYQGGPPLTSFTAETDSNGMFSGSFQINPSWLDGNSNGTFQIYAANPSGNYQNNDAEVAGFTVNSEPNASSNITVSFSKPSYMPTDTITATITGTNSSGGPLANTQVDVHTYSEDYYENNPTENLTNFDNAGLEVPGSPTTVTLNANGQATYTVNTGNLPNDGHSQQITLQANLHGTSSGAAGGASAIVHQGNGILTFGLGRTAVSTTGNVVGRVYATDLNGKALTNTTVNYTLVGQNNNKLVSGSVVTDSSGLAIISIPVPSGVQLGDNLILNATMADSNNNKIEASNYYYIQNSGDNNDTSGAVLEDLDVSGSSGTVSVGQTVNLVINSPTALNAMVTMDRGRIYSSQMLKLNQGNNNFSFSVGSDLAPSFTLTFNYFENGIYHSEGVQFVVNNPSQKASITLTPSSQTVASNTNTSVQVKAEDNNGNPLSTNMIVEVVSAKAYSLNSQVNPDMFTSLYKVLPIMTSSSSSLSGIGSGGGGKCGGGGGDSSGFTNPIGTTLLWQPELSTDSSGNATINFTPTKGQWVISAYSMNGDNVVGSATTTITAN
jgi:hypothetical protein